MVELEERIQQRTTQLEQAMQVKNRFIATMSHVCMLAFLLLLLLLVMSDRE